MTRNQKIFRILLTLFMAMLCIFAAIATAREFVIEIRTSGVIKINPEATPDPLIDELAELIWRYKLGQISVIDLSTITTFAWDRVHIFPQGAEGRALDPIVGRSWRNVDSCVFGLGTIASNSDTADDYSFLVFTNENLVVYCLTHRRSDQSHFGMHASTTKSGISREEALFAIDEQGGISQVKK